MVGMMSNLGIGVMIGMLSSNESTVDAIKSSLGKTIREVTLSDEQLRVGLDGGSVLVLWDDGQSCCEERYMRTDDDLPYYSDAQG